MAVMSRHDWRMPNGGRVGFKRNPDLSRISILTATLEPKRLELLRELVPQVSTIGAFLDPNFPPYEVQLRDLRTAAKGPAAAQIDREICKERLRIFFCKIWVRVRCKPPTPRRGRGRERSGPRRRAFHTASPELYFGRMRPGSRNGSHPYPACVVLTTLGGNRLGQFASLSRWHATTAR
jgi:hypothetical protein